jgi:hypothetical protein
LVHPWEPRTGAFVSITGTEPDTDLEIVLTRGTTILAGAGIPAVGADRARGKATNGCAIATPREPG